MRCRACWSEKTERTIEPRWKVWLAACVLAAPIKCRHCYYQFLVPLWMVADPPAPLRERVLSANKHTAALRKAA
jgi:hypothetical protein